MEIAEGIHRIDTPLGARTNAVYLLTGYRADTEIMTRAGVRLTDRSAPEVNPETFETNVPGLFAAGDVRHDSVKRCASAVGEGAMAVMFVHLYLATG